MRIVSLIPSATEILFDLGLDHEIVGVSHECDYPPRARTKTAVIRSRIPEGTRPAEIDRMVREFVSKGESPYAVHAQILEEIAPDLIVTQDLCHVCAASPDDLASVLARFDRRPEVLCLNPQDLGDVWRDILWVGEETGHSTRAQSILEKIGFRLGQIEIEVMQTRERPSVVLLEWLQPFYVGGHWVPEMISRAGGVDLFGKARNPSYRITVEEVMHAAPDVIFVAPCGYTKEQTRDEYVSMSHPEGWSDIPAVRNGRVYAFDANSYVSRPGPRLVTGIEAMGKALHPQIHVHNGVEGTFFSIADSARAAHV